MVETTIEAKHAYVSTQLRAHYISLVRISLSNRTCMLEQGLLRKKIPTLRLRELFDEWRKMALYPAAVGLRAPGVAWLYEELMENTEFSDERGVPL